MIAAHARGSVPDAPTRVSDRSAVYVVVVHRNELSETAQRSLMAAAKAGFMTVIATNGRYSPGPNSCADLDLYLENRGYGAAVNDTVAALGSRFPSLRHLCFSNDDISIPEEAFGALRRCLEGDREAFAYTLESRLPDGRCYFCGGGVDWRTPHLEHWSGPRKGENAIMRTDAINGAVIALPLGLYTDIGGFDEQFFLYFEDLDLSLRLAQRGVRMFVLRGYSVIHEGSESTVGARPAQRYYYIRSQLRFARKWLGRRMMLVAVARALVRGAIGWLLTSRSDLRRVRRARFLAAWDALIGFERRTIR